MRNKLLVAAFLEGFFLVTLELIGAQLSQPIYGGSYFVWVAILTTTMLASGTGYFLGGFIAEKSNTLIQKYTSIALVVIMAYMLAFVNINNYLLSIANTEHFIFSAIKHTFLLLFIPITLVTSLSPIIVKFYTTISAGVGSSKIFFTSTIGGIISIYTIAFIVLPNLELNTFIQVAAFTSGAIALVTHALTNSYKMIAAQVIIAFFIFGGLTKKQNDLTEGKNTKIVYRSNGIMGEIEIRDELQRRYLCSNRTTQSAIIAATGRSLWSYPYRIATYCSLASENSDVLVAGLGGGILINYLLDLGFNIDCIEFDKRTYGVARKYMGMRAGATIKIDDFRHYVNATDKKYDLIVLDLSKGESIPTNVYTVEAFKKMSTLLNPEGIIVLHYFSDVYRTGMDGLLSILKTMQASGLHAGMVKKQDADQNPEQIIIASNMPTIVKNLNFRVSPTITKKFGFITEDIFNENLDLSNSTVLTDNTNQLEKIQFNVVKEIRQKLITNEKKVFFE